MMKHINNIGLMVVALLCCYVFTACGDDYPTSTVDPYETELLAIKILNAGPDGNRVVEGTIDEENKIINFPRLEVESNFSALRVEATLSQGAHLKDSVFDFSMDEADAYKTLILRVMNQKRYKDYFMKIRKKIPVFGADFDKPSVYNFSGDKVYDSYKSLLTRCADFDGEHVLVVTRSETKPHLLKVSDLKEGKINPIKLDLTGVSGGTFPYNTGALSGGHIYLASLSGGHASPLKIYYYETPTSAPELIADINVGKIEGAGNRHGDAMTLNLDESGNGYIFFPDNGAKEVLRFTVKNFKTISDPMVIPHKMDVTTFNSIYRIENSSDYLWAGIRTPIMLTDANLTVNYSMKKDNFPLESIAPRIFTFNKSRYLITCTAGLGGSTKAKPTLSVYDISKGNTVKEALEIFDKGENHNPVYSFILGGSGNGAPGTQTNYYIEKDANGKDAKLYIFASRANSGFVISEFPVKVAEDD